MKKTYFILIFLIIVMLAMFVMLLQLIRSEANECISSPLTYGVNKVGHDVQCVCINNRITEQETFGINNTNVWWIESQLPVLFDINYGN